MNNVDNCKKIERQMWISVVVDAMIVFLGILGSVQEIQMNDVQMLQYYTTLSNLFIAFCCGMHICYTIGMAENRPVPKWFGCMKFYGVVCMMVTFFVVIFILAPMEGRYSRLLTEGPLLYQHTICPLLSIFSLLLWDYRQIQWKFSMTYISLLPTAVYAVCSTTGNALKIMNGPYPFLRVYEQPLYMSVIWFVLILSLACIIALVIYKIAVFRKTDK